MITTMKFHWEKGEKSGAFTVTAASVDECIEAAEEELDESKGFVITDYYEIDTDM